MGGGGGNYSPEPEEYDSLSLYYRHMEDWYSGGDEYECFPWGHRRVDSAFKPADIVVKIYEGDTVTADSYPRSYAEMSGDIMDRSRDVPDVSPQDSFPWYLEGGIAISNIDSCVWADSTYYGISGMGAPYYSFSIVLVGKIEDEISNTPRDAKDVVAIHELGHQYGHLTDAYGPDSVYHSQDSCCVMDDFLIQNGSILDPCFHFCPMCIDSLMKVDWDYNSYSSGYADIQ